MPNTLTNLKDIRVAQTALPAFTDELLPFGAFSTNFSPDAAEKGDTVRVPLVGAPSKSGEFAGDYTANSDSAVASVPVTLSRHFFKTVHVTARELAETAFGVLEPLAEAAARQLALDVLLDVFSVVTAANYGAPAVPAIGPTAFDYKRVLSVREACGAAKMPSDRRALILDAGYYTNLLADDVVAKAFNISLSGPAVEQSRIKRLAGFELYETGVIAPSHAEKLVGFAVHPSAIAVAVRYLVPAARYDEAGAVTDPATGLTFGYLRFSDTKSNKIYVTVECLYGFTVGRADGLKRLVKP
ncbi:MAG TPA: P22 phage major capsid protein family protein [Verrucomicrobiae bacterium]|nr:P22 phage major capsid protein family protein [Verrucomicrobiae bacterium]